MKDSCATLEIASKCLEEILVMHTGLALKFLLRLCWSNWVHLDFVMSEE